MTPFSRFSNWPVRSLLCALLLILLSTRATLAHDDEQSMRLLVDTLGKVQTPGALKSLMNGMLLGLEGRRDVEAPANWSAVALKL